MESEAWQGTERYERLLARARADSDVVGLILTGSRGRDAFVREESDWDVRLVVEENAVDAAAARYATPHGSTVEVVVLSLPSFQLAGQIGTEQAWDRYSYVHSRIVIDNLDGGIAEMVAEKSRLPTPAARSMAAASLDDYINAYYRALKNDRVGLIVESRLDAAESVPALLIALFAMNERVRPFNRFLRWELEHFPLPGEVWTADRLLPRLRSILATGDIAVQAGLFRDTEALARAHGLGEVVDGWVPDIDRLRSGGV